MLQHSFQFITLLIKMQTKRLANTNLLNAGNTTYITNKINQPTEIKITKKLGTN